MIQTGVKLSIIVDFLKEYLSLIIIVPAFLGGVWQAIELMSISIPYIRFFSISQIVPDGLLIIMFFSVGCSYYLIGWFGDILFFEKRKPEVGEKLNNDEYEKYRKSELRKSTIFFACSYIFWLWSFLYFRKNIIDSDYLEWTIFLSIMIIYGLNYYLKTAYYFAKENNKKYFKGANVLLLIFYLIVINSVFKGIHNVFLTPKNVVNIENIKKDVASKFPNTKQELLYFNDKFIFIKLIGISKRDKKGKKIKQEEDKIYIMELNKLFEKAND